MPKAVWRVLRGKDTEEENNDIYTYSEHILTMQEQSHCIVVEP
jgi:hypothetical protein